MRQGSSVRLTAWVYNPDARRQVILGGAVLLLSSIVLVLVHIASTTPEFITKLRLYVNPESARVCSLARLWFAPCVAVAGFAGCVTCLILAFREARKTKNKRESLLELQESTHWSYLMHATVLAFICLIGIVSRPIGLTTTKSIVMEFSPVDSIASVVPTAARGKTEQFGAAEVRLTGPKPQKRGAAVSQVVAAKKYASPRQKVIPPPITSVIVSDGSSPNSPYASLSNGVSSPTDNLPGEATPDFGFDQSKYLTNVYESGETFGLIDKDGLLEEAVGGETVLDDIGVSAIKVALFEPGTTISTNSVWDWNKSRFRLQPPSVSLDMTPPAPYKVRHIQNLGMAQPEIPKELSDSGISCSGPPLRDNEEGCGHYGPFLRAVRKQIYRHWIPSKEAVPRNAAVLFSVSKHGVMSDLMLDKSSGSSEFDQECLRAVRFAAPFMDLPHCAPESVDIRFSFDRTLFTKSFDERSELVDEKSGSSRKRLKNSKRLLLAQ